MEIIYNIILLIIKILAFLGFGQLYLMLMQGIYSRIGFDLNKMTVPAYCSFFLSLIFTWIWIGLYFLFPGIIS